MEAVSTGVELTQGSSSIVGNGNHTFVPAISISMRAVERMINDIAKTDIPVLVEGQSGTGKSMAGLRIHQLSNRHAGPFLKISCAALTPQFFDGRSNTWSNQELDRAWAQAGTVFFDEITELDAECQPKLLSVLTDCTGRPDTGPALRVIASTHHDLDHAVREGRFREDLYYRICGVCLRLPPLRQRREDIPVLLDHFVTRYAALLGRQRPEISAQNLRQLMEHSWPGNERELEHCAQKIVALGDERVALADLHSNSNVAYPENGEKVSLKQAARAASRQAERELIVKVLSHTRWNRKRAAQQLQISYKALLYKMKQIGLDSVGH